MMIRDYNTYDEVKPERGMQIMYVPNHVRNTDHPWLSHHDVELGFVTSFNDELVRCRFYDKDGNLRTKANSESCYPDTLYAYTYMSQSIVDEDLERYC